MNHHALYDVLSTQRQMHKTVVELAESLDETQLTWRPANYATSIGFHVWHLAREADFLKWAVLHHFPLLQAEFGTAQQIWHVQKLAAKWNFPANLGKTEVGTGISDELARELPVPPKAELLAYLRQAYEALDSLVEQLDQRYPTFNETDEALQKQVERVRANLLVFLTHDCRHLGMMECLKGLLTGFGSATEKRENDGTQT